MKENYVIIATHRDYTMPEDSLYLPVQVGAEGKEFLGYRPDNTGDNISIKNPYFSELTGLYWAWKNLDFEYLGVAHYRRHLSQKPSKSKNVSDRVQSAITKDEVETLLQTKDAILPKKRKYYIESLYSHYANTLHVEPLDITGQIIDEMFPDYSKSFERLKKETSGFMFNMFIMKKELINQYCEWLFSILFELEKRTDSSQYTGFHARYFGRVSELLFNVWLWENDIDFVEVKTVDAEPVNWIKKGTAFLKAKFTKEKYESSF